MSNLDPISIPGAESFSIGGRLKEEGREHHGCIRNSRLEGWAQSFRGWRISPGRSLRSAGRKESTRNVSGAQSSVGVYTRQSQHWLGLHRDTVSSVKVRGMCVTISSVVSPEAPVLRRGYAEVLSDFNTSARRTGKVTKDDQIPHSKFSPQDMRTFPHTLSPTQNAFFPSKEKLKTFSWLEMWLSW